MAQAADGSANATSILRVVAGTLFVMLLTAGPETSIGAAALFLAGIPRRRGKWLGSLVLWLGGGAVVGGAVGWGIASVVAPSATALGLGFGIAVGGGLGTVLNLLGTDQQGGRDTMTVDIDADEEQTVPSPQPVDLFESHPDPVLYFDDRGEGPVVRAVNDAFSEMFGVGTDTVAGAALADVLMVAERSGDVVEAAADADQFDAILDCETVEGQTRFYVRVVALGDETGARGYVLYSPVRPGETPR